MKNEMLVVDDKYESYRLGYKRGHDRGYEFRKQQEEAEDFVVNRVQVENDKLKERIVYLGVQYREAAYTIKQLKEERDKLKEENEWLNKELDDKIQMIVVLRHVNEQLKKSEVIKQ